MGASVPRRGEREKGGWTGEFVLERHMIYSPAGTTRLAGFLFCDWALITPDLELFAFIVSCPDHTREEEETTYMLDYIDKPHLKFESGRHGIVAVSKGNVLS